MAASYPNSTKTFSTHVNVTEIIDAGHPNALQDEVVAIETELGTNPHLTSSFSASGFSSASANGAIQTVTARLNNIESGLVADVHPQYIKNATIQGVGDLLVGTGAQTVGRIGIGTSGYVLTSNGTTASWQQVQGLNGSNGTQGTQGTTGLQGATGTQGLTGAQGFGYAQLQGTTGATGLQGIQGIQGTNTTITPINLQSVQYTITTSDQDKLIGAVGTGAQYISIPTNATAAFPIGSVVHVAGLGSGAYTIQAVTPGVTSIQSTGATSTAPKIRTQYAAAEAVKIATDTWLIVGDIS